MSIRIGKYLKHCLEGDAGLMEATGGRVWPVVAPMDAPQEFPYVVYASNGFDEEETKDGLYGARVSIEVLVVARDIETLEDVGESVRRAMAAGWPKWNDGGDNRPFMVGDQSLRVGAEDFIIELDGLTLPMTYTIDVED